MKYHAVLLRCIGGHSNIIDKPCIEIQRSKELIQLLTSHISGIIGIIGQQLVVADHVIRGHDIERSS